MDDLAGGRQAEVGAQPQGAAAPPAPAAACLDEIGPSASARLVERCVAVSPATRPPCNAANPCELIQGEIDRACETYPPGQARPAECGA